MFVTDLSDLVSLTRWLSFYLTTRYWLYLAMLRHLQLSLKQVHKICMFINKSEWYNFTCWRLPVCLQGGCGSLSVLTCPEALLTAWGSSDCQLSSSFSYRGDTFAFRLIPVIRGSFVEELQLWTSSSCQTKCRVSKALRFPSASALFRVKTTSESS